MIPAFVISNFFHNTSDFVKWLSAGRLPHVSMLRGDTSFESCQHQLKGSNRIWFEGIGRLFEELLVLEKTDSIPRAVLRINDKDLMRIKNVKRWSFVTDIIVSSQEMKLQVVRRLREASNKARVHVVLSSNKPVFRDGTTPWAEIQELARILILPTETLPENDWKAIWHLSNLSVGRVRIFGDAPEELAVYLTQAHKCEIVPTSQEENSSPIDTLIYWRENIDELRQNKELRQADNNGVIVCIVQDDRLGSRPNAISGFLGDTFKDTQDIEYDRESGVASVKASMDRDDEDVSNSSSKIEVGGGHPLVSTITPVYNNPIGVVRAIKSLQGQTYSNLQIVVIDDGSTDATADVLEQFKEDKRFEYYRKEHSGRPMSRNEGLLRAKGDFVAWLDADDEAMPRRIEKQMEAITANSLVDVVHSNGFYFDADGQLEFYRYYEPIVSGDSARLLFTGLVDKCPVLNTSALVRKIFYDKVGHYDPNFLRYQDYEIWVRAAQKGIEFKLLEVPLVNVYQGASNPGHRFVKLDYYYEIASRMLKMFALHELAGGTFEETGEEPVLVVAQVLVKGLQILQIPSDHPFKVLARRYVAMAFAKEDKKTRAGAITLLGKIMAYEENENAALEEFQRALRVKPNSIEAWRGSKLVTGKVASGR